MSNTPKAEPGSERDTEGRRFRKADPVLAGCFAPALAASGVLTFIALLLQRPGILPGVMGIIAAIAIALGALRILSHRFIEAPAPRERGARILVRPAAPEEGAASEHPMILQHLSIVGQQRLKTLLPPPELSPLIAPGFFIGLVATVGLSLVHPLLGLTAIFGFASAFVLSLLQARARVDAAREALTLEPFIVEVREAFDGEVLGLACAAYDALRGAVPTPDGEPEDRVALRSPPRGLESLKAGTRAILIPYGAPMLLLEPLPALATGPVARG